MNRFIQKYYLKLNIDRSGEFDTERIYDNNNNKKMQTKQKKTFQFQSQLTNTLIQ